VADRSSGYGLSSLVDAFCVQSRPLPSCGALPFLFHPFVLILVDEVELLLDAIKDLLNRQRLKGSSCSPMNGQPQVPYDILDEFVVMKRNVVHQQDRIRPPIGLLLVQLLSQLL
jgi:hypothetical protein